MKIRTKINVSFSVAFFLIMVLVGLAVGIYSTNLVRKHIYSYLNTSNRARAEHVRTFIQDQMALADVLAASVVYRDFLIEPVTSDQYPLTKEKVAKRLRQTPAADPLIYEALIIDPDGKTVASSDPSQEGNDESNDEYFIEGKKGTFIKDVYYLPAINKISYAISAPIKDDKGTLLGVSVLRFFPDNLISIVKSENGLGDTEESFLINKDKYFITPSHFLGESVILKQKDEAKNANDCFDPKETDYIKNNGYSGLDDSAEYSHIVEAKDYRNVDIIGTHAYIPETNWCLITKADKTDLMSFKSTLIIIFTLTFFSAELIFLLIVFLISQRITKPINKLREGVETIIEKENFNFKIGTGLGNDEIGELVKSFDKMTATIKKIRDEGDKKAKQQTEDLLDKSQILENQQKAILNVVEDVEVENRRAIREKDRINAILHSLGEGVFVVDENFKVIIINNVAAKMAGYKTEDILGTKYTDKLKFIIEDTEKINDQFVSKAIETKTIQEMSSRRVLVDKAGNKIPVSYSAAPLLDKDGKVTGCVVVFRDITHERAIDKSKTEFVSLASHQLRTPLSAIKWYTEMMLDGDAGKINEKQKKFLKEIYHGGSRMVELVNTMLNVSRLELGTFIIELKPTNISYIAESVINELMIMAKSKGLRLKKEYDSKCPIMSVDPKLLRIILQNLLSNAVKYTPKGGLVTMEIKPQKSDLLIKVADTGTGIPKDAVPNIFTRFFRADNAREIDPEGNGLDLYIVKTIVDHAGCKIWFKSEEKKGTTFYLTIPLTGMREKEGTKELI